MQVPGAAESCEFRLAFWRHLAGHASRVVRLAISENRHEAKTGHRRSVGRAGLVGLPRALHAAACWDGCPRHAQPWCAPSSHSRTRRRPASSWSRRRRYCWRRPRRCRPTWRFRSITGGRSIRPMCWRDWTGSWPGALKWWASSPTCRRCPGFWGRWWMVSKTSER